MSTKPLLTSLACITLLSACDRNEAPEPVDNVVGNEVEQPVSIIRDDVREEVGADEIEDEGPIRAVIGFSDGGADLDDAAIAALDELMEADRLEGDQAIFLWGHSDTVGSDAANFRAGQARAEAVADYLVGKGVDRERIEIVSLGEGNPAEPNYLPDGSDNAAGQAANRRVEIQIGDAVTQEAEAASEAIED